VGNIGDAGTAVLTVVGFGGVKVSISDDVDVRLGMVFQDLLSYVFHLQHKRAQFYIFRIFSDGNQKTGFDITNLFLLVLHR
jgi:hypothetical protein